MSFARRHKQDGVARAPSAAGAANAVYIGFGVDGNIKVDDMADAFDVQTACGDVGGDQNINGAIFQLANRAFAHRLLHVAIDRCSGKTARFQFLRQLFCAYFGAAEHDHGFKRFNF